MNEVGAWVTEQLGRHVEGRTHPEEEPADEGRRAGGEGHRQEGAHAHLGHHQLDGEHDAAERRVEGRRDARAGAGGDECDALPGVHVDQLSQGRPERGANLDDGTLASDRSAGADRERRGERFHQRPPPGGFFPRDRRSRP